jgi:hypothetical protein
MDSIVWLQQNEPEVFKNVSREVLKDGNKNYERTGKIFNSFDLLRQIIELTQKKQEQRRQMKIAEGS